MRLPAFALLILYALVCAAASYGLGMAFGLAAQLIALPLFFLGGVLLGRSIA